MQPWGIPTILKDRSHCEELLLRKQMLFLIIPKVSERPMVQLERDNASQAELVRDSSSSCLDISVTETGPFQMSNKNLCCTWAEEGFSDPADSAHPAWHWHSETELFLALQTFTKQLNVFMNIPGESHEDQLWRIPLALKHTLSSPFSNLREKLQTKELSFNSEPTVS